MVCCNSSPIINVMVTFLGFIFVHSYRSQISPCLKQKFCERHRVGSFVWLTVSQTLIPPSHLLFSSVKLVILLREEAVMDNGNPSR